MNEKNIKYLIKKGAIFVYIIILMVVENINIVLAQSSQIENEKDTKSSLWSQKTRLKEEELPQILIRLGTVPRLKLAKEESQKEVTGSAIKVKENIEKLPDLQVNQVGGMTDSAIKLKKLGGGKIRKL